LGEAVRLRTADVDLDHGRLMIHRSKGRSRIVAIRSDLVHRFRSSNHILPVELQRFVPERRSREREDSRNRSTVAELRNYIAERQRLMRERRRSDPEAFFLRRDASPLAVGSASHVIRRLLRQLDLKPPSGRSCARPYAFRHAFAVHRLRAWANESVDVHAKLPVWRPSAHSAQNAALATRSGFLRHTVTALW
jgi:integrase/recombinase XerD